MGRARLLNLAEPLVQARRITHSTGIRHATVPRTTTIAPVDDDDIELIVSSFEAPDSGYIAEGYLYSLDDQIIYISYNFGSVGLVSRHGDAFNLDLDTGRGIADNTRLGGNTEFVNGGVVTMMRNNANFAALGDGKIIGHSSVSATGGPRYPHNYDEFIVLDVNADAGTARWGITQRPLADGGTASSLGSETNHSTRLPYKMARLDNTHAAAAGNSGEATGRRPRLFLLELDGDDKITSYGPFTFGAKSAEGGNRWNQEMILLPMTGDRLLALWHDSREIDNTNSAYIAHKRTLHAQVLSYDLDAHTVTPGPLRRFESGIEGGDMHAVYYPDSDIAVLFSQNWEPPEHIAARSLIIQGTDVLNGHGGLRVLNAPTELTGWDNHWYSFQVVGAGDRLAVLWGEVGDAGGDIRYTKVRVGVTGAERGALGVYDEGVLIANTGIDIEPYREGPQVQLPDGSGLALFEHYLDDYNRAAYRFVLAKEQA